MKKSTRIILIVLCSLCSIFVSFLFLIPLYFLVRDMLKSPEQIKQVEQVKKTNNDEPDYFTITNDFNILNFR